MNTIVMMISAGRKQSIVKGLLRLSLGFCLVMTVSFFVHASPVETNELKVDFISELKTIQPGSTFWVGAYFEMKPDWHIYWQNSGESGIPTTVDWTLPLGSKATGTKWPYPERVEISSIVTFAYHNSVVLLSQVSIPKGFEIGKTYTMEANINWLACKEICIPGEAKLVYDFPVSAASEVDEKNRPIFDRAIEKLPEETSEWKQSARKEGKKIVLNLQSDEFKGEVPQLEFFPITSNLIDLHSETVTKKTENGLEISLSVLDEKTKVEKLEGVLVADRAFWNSRRALSIAAPLIVAEPDLQASSGNQMTIWLAFLFSILGGLILNLMPCVLPVLSIKVLGFVKQAAEDKRKVWKHVFVFSFGILLSFWVFAFLTTVIKLGGERLGWGFQLQSPIFVFFLMCLFFAMALNLFGVFEVGTSLTGISIDTSKKSNLFGSFISGVLATIVATPCTAPFMGSALGFTLTQPAWVTFLVFTGLGIGLSLPYIVLSLSPKFLSLVPKPGPWMIRLKQIMGILLLLTSFWLGSVLYLQIGMREESKVQNTGITWQKFSPEKVNELREKQVPVFIDFTAAWCLSCQVNEKVTFSSKKVQQQFSELGVIAMKADWTKRDKVVTKALQDFGRNGVPLYVLYDRNGNYQILPEILTPGILLKEFEKLGRKS